MRPRRISSSNCPTASSGPSPTRSPDSRTSSFEPDAVALDDGEEEAALLRLAQLGESLDQLHSTPLDEHVDLAAAGQADAPGEVVVDPVREELGLAGLEHGLGALEDVALDASAGHRAAHLPRLGDRQARAERPRRRAAGADDRCDHDLLAGLEPALHLGQDLLHAACLLSMPASTAASSSRLRRLWPGRNRSTKGSAQRMPPASGWYSGFPFSGLTHTTA